MHIGTREAAKRLGISTQAVYQLLQSGALHGERRNIMGVTVWAIDERSVTKRVSAKKGGRPEAA